MPHAPAIHVSRNVSTSVDQLGTYLPVMGQALAVNAFLLRSREPVLVDAGIVTMQEPFLQALESLLDPAELRFIYLTHVDADHIGGLETLLRRAPRARVVTTFLGMAKLGLARSIAPERFLLRNPGEALDAGDRQLTVHRPPCFDAPETTMLWDPSSSTLFSSDYFGALVPTEVEAANEVPAATLRAGMMAWLAVDSPWIHGIDPAALARATRAVAALGAKTVLSAHLAPARNMLDALSANVLEGPKATPFVGPSHAMFEQMLAGAAA
jgi:glyoxylase-like metal-dependent hydrolase (beta-lactamase superfamily II)